MTAAAARAADARANAAAADAAADARADARTEVVTKIPGVTKATAAKATRNGYYHFIVDIWITNFNAIEFGIYKRTRNRAKSRQFTSDMDIFAEVIEGGQRTGLIGYREDTWKKVQTKDKRLVFKLFNDSLNWRATMDLMLGRSMQQTIASRGMPVMVYSINTDQDDFVVYLERSANKWPLMPENFGFFIPGPNNRPVFYRLQRDFINLGGDYTLYDEHGRNVGHIDGKVFSIGGKWKGRVRIEHADRRLLTVLQLFSAMQIFNSECRRYLRRMWRDVRKGRTAVTLDAQELDLYKNPRRIR